MKLWKASGTQLKLIFFYLVSIDLFKIGLYIYYSLTTITSNAFKTSIINWCLVLSKDNFVNQCTQLIFIFLLSIDVENFYDLVFFVVDSSM